MFKVKFKKSETVERNWIDRYGKPLPDTFKVDIYRLTSETDDKLSALSWSSIEEDGGFYSLEKELYGSYRVYHIVFRSKFSSLVVLADRHNSAIWFRTIKEAETYLNSFLEDKFLNKTPLNKWYWVNPEKHSTRLLSWKPTYEVLKETVRQSVLENKTKSK